MRRMKELKTGDAFAHQRECDRYRPIYYAGASGDYNPIHIDHEVGKLVGLGGAILQGLCTLGWAVEAAARYAGDPGRVKKVRVRFSRPVRVEDTVKFEGRVARVEGGRAVAELTAKNQDGEDVLKGAVVELET
ncbi:MAG TPA: MaoC family dehydratase [Myxococcales bacterium]|jgi:acyl dehydratase|nr:MaoC family dehydratase [Myxococcales bacterium]